MKSFTRIINPLFVVLAASGCSLGPDYIRPEIELGNQFSETAPTRESIANLPWWEIFDDSVLQELVRTSLENNQDLEISLERVAESRARLGFVRADLFPRLDVSGVAGRFDPSDAILLSDGGATNDFGTFANLSYEIDLWGRVRRASEAQRAELLSSEYAHRSVTISLLSAVAETYFTLLDLDARRVISERTVTNRRNSTNLIRQRLKGGIVPEIDVNQAEIQQAEAEVELAAINRGIRQTENALNVLLGRASGAISRGPALNQQKLPKSISAGFPASLLERRPDVLAAEELVRAETARIGVAEAERLPRLNLTGIIGLESASTDDFDAGAKSWGFAGDLLGPLLDFGKSRSRVEQAEAQAAQALANYKQTVFQSVREVEDALVAIRTFGAELEARFKQRAAARNAYRLSWARYNEGVSPYLEVLDAERSQFDSELAASSTERERINSIVQLYKALGGGWTTTESDLNSSPTTP